MKKWWSLVLAVICLVSAVPTMGAVFTDTEGQSCETATEVLYGLGIVNGTEEGVYAPEALLTRAEMTAIVLRTMNMAGTGQGTPIFEDVSDSHWAYADISVAHSLGIVNGYGEGIFMPEANVTGEQAVKMMIAALGYTVQAEAKGGYPSGYLAKAAELDILKGISVNGPITRGDMAILVYNALDVEVFLPESYGSDAYSYETDASKTLLSYYLKTDHLVGAVSETPMHAYRDLAMRPTKKLAEDEVAVGTRVMKVGKTDAQNLFGIRSDIYIRAEEDGETEVIAAIVPRSSVQVVDVFAKEIAKGETTENLFVYMNESGREEEVNLSGASLFYNGREERRTAALLTPAIGTVRLIFEGNDCKYVIVESFVNYIVESVNEADNKIYLKNVTEPMELDAAVSGIPTLLTDEFGAPLQTDEIAKWDILSVAESLGTDKVRRIYRSYETVKGTVTELGEDEVRIGESVYPVALPLADGQLVLGQKAAYRLDFTGAVAAADTRETAGKNYGWFVNAEKSKGLSGKAQIRIFTGKAEWEVFTLQDTLRFNGENVKGEALLLSGMAAGEALWAPGEAPTLFDSAGNVVPQLVTYKLNDEGLISELNTAANHTDPVMRPETKYKDNRFSMDWYWNGNRYRYAGYITEFNGTKNGNTLKQTADGYTENVSGVFFGNVQTDAETKVFVIPANQSDEKAYAVLTMSQFDFETVRVTDCGSLYDINDAYYCGAIVVHNYLAGGTASSVETYPGYDVTNALITKASVVLGEDGEVQHILALYDQNGKEFTLTVEEDFRALYKTANADINKDLDWYTVDEDGLRLPRTGNITARPAKMYIDAVDLQAGDIIKYTKDAGGKLTMACVCYRNQYPGNVEFSAGTAIVPTTPYLNYMGGSLLMNGFVEEVTDYGPLVRVNMANSAGMPTGDTALRALLSEGQFLLWDSEKQEMKKITRGDIRLGDTVVSIWATVQQRITVIYR